MSTSRASLLRGICEKRAEKSEGVLTYRSRKQFGEGRFLPRRASLPDSAETARETIRIRAKSWRNSDSTTNPMRKVQLLDFAANRTTLFSDPSPLRALAIGQLGLNRLMVPCSSQHSGKSVESCSRFVNHTLFKKCKDCEPRIKRIARIEREEVSMS